MISGFVLISKAYFTSKKSIGEWANKLLTNHLAHIQVATETTVAETKKTNALLDKAAQSDLVVAERVQSVAQSLNSHTEKQMEVWTGVVKTLSVLEDRTRRSSRTPRTPRKRKS